MLASLKLLVNNVLPCMYVVSLQGSPGTIHLVLSDVLMFETHSCPCTCIMSILTTGMASFQQCISTIATCQSGL